MPPEEHLLRVLGPGSYTRLSERTGISRQHIGRVLRGDARGSTELLGRIAGAAGVEAGDVRRYIDQGGSPGVGLPALRLHHPSIPMISCPRPEEGSKWDGLRELVAGLEPGEVPSPDSAVRVVLADKDEASKAAQCLHAGKRSRSNLLRGVEFTTSVDGNVLSVWVKRRI